MGKRILTAGPAILCGLAFLLSTGLANAMESTAKRDSPIDAKSFRCITKMTPVRQFYVDNLRGDLNATLAAANSTTGAVYPPGSVIQLVPGEAMVARIVPSSKSEPSASALSSIGTSGSGQCS